MIKDTAKPSLAVIGAGYWGKNLARNFHKLGVLHTICDTNTETLKQHKPSYPNVTFTNNIETVLQDHEVSALAITTPTSLHYPLAKKALLAGKDVFVEKPICLNCDQAEDLLSIADSKKLVLMVGHILHYHPCIESLKHLLAEQALGDLRYIVSNRLSLGIMRTEENVLWNFAPHDVSLILSLCNDQYPETIRCTGESYLAKNIHDTALTVLQFSQGITAQIHTSWLNPFKEQRLTIIGTRGMAVFDDTQAWEDKLLVYYEPVKWLNHIPIPNKTTPKKIIVPHAEPLHQECVHFISCCEKRTTPYTDGQEGIRVLKVLEAAQASLDQGGEVQSIDHNISANASSL